MAYPKEIMDKAFETLAERRSQARNDYQYRLQVIREKAPAVEELRRELTGTSAAIARTVLSGVDVEQKLARLRDTNLYMQQHRCTSPVKTARIPAIQTGRCATA